MMARYQVKEIYDYAFDTDVEFSEPVSDVPATEKKQNAYKRCVVSSFGKRKESRYQCEDCSSDPGLCVVPCMKIYHTSNDKSFN